ncbi:DUF4386 domain-containing protein [Egicoccus sp. AB-alg2]|uniref:DUF4386 domain-containing protein n=1 Tax=Egicoccus sp. AB-alg2 TaxID=3242693 RepID=UPI00359D64E0
MTSATRTPSTEPRSKTGRAPGRTRARAIGLLFLAAMFTYGPGSGIVASFVDAPDFLTRVADRPSFFVSGAVLMLLNCAVVVAIGVLTYPILRPANERVALGYLACRIIEGTLLALGVVALLTLIPIADMAGGGTADIGTVSTFAVAVNDISYQVGMAALGLGSLFFCRLLDRAGLVPRPLAIWGLVGYAVFLAGALLELFGLAGGLVLSLPGGLFEVFFGGWLIARGFTGPQTPHGPPNSNVLITARDQVIRPT